MLRLFAVLLALLALGGCAREEQRHKTSGHVFGTTVEVTIYGGTREHADALAEKVMAEFDRLHRKYHAWQPSMLTGLNDAIANGEPFVADAEMADLLKSAAALSARSDHLFNPTIGHLIRLWGFQSSTFEPKAPPEAEIRRWLDANPTLDDLRFDGTTVTSINRAVMIDLGGYAKGYALDRAAAILRAAHVKAALVNIGGNVIAIGQPGAKPWQVGIRDPRGNGTVAMVPLHDNEAMGTSGDYERYFLKDGKRRPHIIDPRTGYPIDLVASVTIVTSGGKDVGLRSDGNSKPLFITGPAGWEQMAERLGLKEVLMVDTERKVYVTPALQARLGH
ncbi:thiamine biosynthesis lipoprotein [Pseudoduganella flava]|uniref:FAD:protein FMN transferase n=1 Tax=Pseudoduganella flava TaxID=871742 RepID=A0A562PHY1_9BURK|nr:FAD:protein FMN transferase [Pseudoduganella flava]QGZ42674.1 FAD:protein FMN transferase [Pseudoduganella flava]TWI43840.1 thiamine biosynthesis lipoprotein [Pseudoduganella flava]